MITSHGALEGEEPLHYSKWMYWITEKSIDLISWCEGDMMMDKYRWWIPLLGLNTKVWISWQPLTRLFSSQPMYYTEEPGRRSYDTYRMYLKQPHGYDDPYLDEVITYPPTADYSSQPHGLKSTTNYVDFYASTRRPSYRAEQYPGSPDSWV